MRWFEGGIAEAVATSKSRNAVFVVFVEGKDDTSKNAAATVDDVAVSSKLESDDFVAIKLDSESEAYRQFAQIYQLVPIPSLFFIGGNGVPLEVVAGEVNVPELLRRINLVLEKSGKTVSQENKTPVAETQESTQEPTKNNTEESGSSKDTASSSEEAAENVTATAETEAAGSTDSSQTLTTEEKVERAKELLEKKRKLKQEEEEEAQKLKEMERRKMGQEVQKLRRWQQDQELKQLREERQREKAEEAAARERILQQIAQDKAERASRFGMAQDTTKKQEEDLKKRSEEQAKEAAAKCDVARIQFRLPDGSTHSHNFEASATLGEVRIYAATQLNFPFREFAMSTAFPRREFTANYDSQTVRDLQLVPTAVILILPAASGTVVSSSSNGSGLTNMVWSLLTPLFSLLNYLRTLLFGGGGGSRAIGGNNFGQNSSERNTQQSTTNSTGAKRRTPTSETTAVRRQGNIHRLTNRHDSSDDENNTWNGNSTQQM